MNCLSCNKEMFPAKYDGQIAVVDGDQRCEECKRENRLWQSASK